MPTESVAELLAETGVDFVEERPGTYVVRLPTASRGTLPVFLEARERTLTFRAFLLRRPDTNHAEVYRQLLRAQLDTPLVRSALDDSGDVYLLADVARRALDAAELDGILGHLSTTIDALVPALIRTGFATAPSTR
ncbi:MAG: YbjN domain-containing protein [Actinobacteria bacterium]|nr:YbjN domain-containing protein [Actinomycetota bacterium]